MHLDIYVIKLLNVESLNFSFKQIFILVYLRYDYYNFFFQVVAVAGFTQVEEVEGILVVPSDGAEKVVRDFFREGWVEEPGTTISWVGLEEVVELKGMEMEEEEAEGILAEAVEIIGLIPVGVEVDPLMLETIRPMTVVTPRLGMVT